MPMRVSAYFVRANVICIYNPMWFRRHIEYVLGTLKNRRVL